MSKATTYTCDLCSKTSQDSDTMREGKLTVTIHIGANQLAIKRINTEHVCDECMDRLEAQLQFVSVNELLMGR